MKHERWRVSEKPKRKRKTMQDAHLEQLIFVPHDRPEWPTTARGWLRILHVIADARPIIEFVALMGLAVILESLRHH